MDQKTHVCSYTHLETSWSLLKAITRYSKWTPTFTSVQLLWQNSIQWPDLCFGFGFGFDFPPKGYAILLLKKGCSRLDDVPEIPARMYIIAANPGLVAGQGDLQGSLGDTKPWQPPHLTNKQSGWPCGLHYLGCTLLLSQLRCCLALVLGRSNLCFRHRRWSVNVSGPSGWHGSWSVSLRLNCWAVSQQSVSIPKVKMSQPLNHRQASWRTFRISTV